MTSRWLALFAWLLAGVALAQSHDDLGTDGGVSDGGDEVPGAPIPPKKPSRFGFGCSFAPRS